jgi:hypothetical protein
MKGNCPTCKQEMKVREYTIIVREHNTTYLYQGEPDLKYLNLRGKLAGGISYYKLYLEEGIKPEAMIVALNRYPYLFDKSDMLELI